MTGGTARGVRLLSPAGCERALETRFAGFDPILGATMRDGIGYGRYSGSRTYFGGGYGGSMVLVGLDARLTVAYAMNRMVDEGTPGDERALAVVLAAYEGVSAAA